jgi:hypothetical protein
MVLPPPFKRKKIILEKLKYFLLFIYFTTPSSQASITNYDSISCGAIAASAFSYASISRES